MIGLVLLSIVVVGLVMLAMAVGPIFSRRCLRGSCGALGAQADDLACDVCPLRPRGDDGEPSVGDSHRGQDSSSTL